jgi:hypothetical protein
MSGEFLAAFVVVFALILAFEIWMFIDAVRNPRLTDLERLLWCLGMLLIHPFVAIFYYFMARSDLEV